MTSFGLYFDDTDARQRGILAAIQQPLGYGDPRSKRIRDLCAMGLAIEDGLNEIDGPDPWGSPQEMDRILKRAIVNEYRRMHGDSTGSENEPDRDTDGGAIDPDHPTH